MGVLHYGSHECEFDDELLAHLQLVILKKISANEPFIISWRAGKESGTNRQAILIDTGIPIRFEYCTDDLPTINNEWVVSLAVDANRPEGLSIY